MADRFLSQGNSQGWSHNLCFVGDPEITNIRGRRQQRHFFAGMVACPFVMHVCVLFYCTSVARIRRVAIVTVIHKRIFLVVLLEFFFSFIINVNNTHCIVKFIICDFTALIGAQTRPKVLHISFIFISSESYTVPTSWYDSLDIRQHSWWL